MSYNYTLLFANNANTTLATSAQSTSTTIQVASGTASIFPAIIQGEAIVLTISSATNPLLTEIVWCTAISGDTLTILRGQEGTTARAWNAGDYVANLITAGTNSSFAQLYGLENALYSASFQNMATVTGQITTLPINPTDIPNKQYVDSLYGTSAAKYECQVATTANITLAGLFTIDGYTVNIGDRVLVKNQTNQAENGIYVAASLAWSRAVDMSVWNEVPGATTFVQYGTLYANTGWVAITAETGTINVTPITWAQFAGYGTYTAGTGLTLAGTQFSITNTGVNAGAYGTSAYVPAIVTNAQGQLTSASNVLISIAPNQINSLIPNASLQNYAITINGNLVDLGGSTTVTATASNPLTIGTGLAGGSYNGSLPVTISIDSTVATLAGTQTLTNKNISGATNTLQNIPNSALDYSSVTFNGVTVPLGQSGTITADTNNTLTIGTGLTGGSFNGSVPITVAIGNTGVTAGSYTYGSFTVNAQGQLTLASSNPTTGSGNIVLSNSPTISGAWGSPDSLQFNTSAVVTPAIGKLYWDGYSTLNFGMSASTIQSVGFDQFYYIKATVAITAGQVVMFTGAVGASGVLQGAPAQGVTKASYIMGIAAENIPLNGFGFVQAFGLVQNLNTNAWTQGTVLYYDPSVVGGLTATEPVAPNVKVQLASVVNQGTGNGSLFVRRQESGTINNITEVQVTNPLNYNLLQYNGTIWQNVASLNGVPIGSTYASSGAFTTLNASGAVTLSNYTGYLYGNGSGALTASTTIPTTALSGTVTNAQIQYPYVTLGTTQVNLGATATSLAGLSTITVTQSPVGSYDLATKQYVDNAATGFQIHTAALYDYNDTNLAGTYANGGTTVTVTAISGGTTLTATNHGLSVGDVVVPQTTANGLTAGTAYFVYTVIDANDFTISYAYESSQVTTLTDGTGLSIALSANSGVGATLTSTTNTALIINGNTLSVGNRVLLIAQANGYENGIYALTQQGSGTQPWILTRATDGNKYIPSTPLGLAYGSYFLITGGNDGGESYVLTTSGTIIFGTTNIVFTQFAQVTPYTAGTGLTLTGQQFNIANTGVTAGSYGSASAVGSFTVNAQGQLTLASNTPIAISASQVTSGTFASSLLSGSYSGITGVGTLTTGVWNASTIATSYGGTGASGTLTGYVYGNGTGAMTASTTIPNTAITGLGTLSTQNANNVAISGGTIDGTAIGSLTPAGITGTTITATTQFNGPGTGLTGTASGLSIGGTATYATNIAGGLANELVYQTGAGATGFITAPTASGQYLEWNGTSFTWTGLGTIVNTFSAGTTGLTPSSPTSGNVTLAGTLNYTNGGTGLSATPTNGQLLIGNGSGYTLAGLTAGTAISVTNGLGSITIDNTGVTSLSAGSGISVSSATGGVTVSNTGVTSFNTRTGAITLSSTDISGALGYTPASTTGSNATGTWPISITGDATFISGGLANEILYQTGAGTTGFIAAPTTSSTYLEWTGTSFAWTPVTSGLTITNTTANATYYIGFQSATSGSTSTDYINSGFTYNPSTNTVATNISGTAYNASHLQTTAGVSTWNWSGQSGQPTWLWGSNDGVNMYVWNPSNFSVNYANSSGSAGSINSGGGLQNMTVNNIGSYQLGSFSNNTGTHNWNDNISGGAISAAYNAYWVTGYGTSYYSYNTTTLPGTWRWLGGSLSALSFVRIA